MGDDDKMFMMWYYNQSGYETGRICKKLDDEYVVPALGFNKFDEKIRIPADARFEKLKNIMYFCRDAVPDPMLNGVELAKWNDYIRDKCLTINDIRNLKKNDKIKVLLMDRNLGDIVINSNNPDELYDPKIFFREKLAIYIHDHDLSGFIIWDFEVIENGISNSDIDLSAVTMEFAEPFEFEIEYKLHNWYPLKNNQLPDFDHQGPANFGNNAGKHYNEFPNETLIGWRGPMMLWDKLDDIDTLVYWHDPVAKE